MMPHDLPTYAELARGLLSEMSSEEATEHLSKRIYSDLIGTEGFAHRHHARRIAEDIIFAILNEE